MDFCQYSDPNVSVSYGTMELRVSLNKKTRRLDSFLVRTLILILCQIFLVYMPITAMNSKIEATILILVSLYLIKKSIQNLPLLVMFLFIFYVNYSIAVGEYLAGGKLGAILTGSKTVEIYGLSLRITLLFLVILALFVDFTKFTRKFQLKIRENKPIFLIFLIGIVIIFFIGVERGARATYSVRITPLYEYSKVLTLVAFYFSGNLNKYRKILLVVTICFIFQDFYYGGRVTSLQLMIFMALTVYEKRLTHRSLFIVSATGVFLMNTVSSFRANFLLSLKGLFLAVTNTFRDLFVFDTSVYAYYATATHVDAAKNTISAIRYKSFLDFGAYIFTGNSRTGEVTSFVKQLGYFNQGGGLFPSHFYFWLGWTGVFLAGFLVVFVINSINLSKRLHQVLFLGIVISVPRWYLYSPSAFFRNTLFILPLVYLIAMYVDGLFRMIRPTRQTLIK